jgi:hypothetical protein
MPSATILSLKYVAVLHTEHMSFDTRMDDMIFFFFSSTTTSRPLSTMMLLLLLVCSVLGSHGDVDSFVVVTVRQMIQQEKNQNLI